jgi:monothiol bacilliredoxin
MTKHFSPLNNQDDLEALIGRSHQQPVVIFKHSASCPLSAEAYEEMGAVKGPVALLVVQQARALSQEVASRTGITHESPQVIILKDGKVVWHTSHWNVKAGRIAEVLQETA